MCDNMMERELFLEGFNEIIEKATKMLLEYYENEELEAYPEEAMALQAIVHMFDDENMAQSMLKKLTQENMYRLIINTPSDNEYFAKNGFRIKNIDYDDNQLFIDILPNPGC